MANMKLGDTRRIVDACAAAGLLRNQAAYVLATAFWETARTMKPVREYGGEKYLRSKKYYPYVGMGYVQLTWRENYEKAGKKLGVDFVGNPKLLLKPEHAAPILVIGMKEGWFTGKKLSDYITLSKSDFKGARRIVNGTDKAAEIAAIASDYDAALKAEGYGETAASTAPAKPTAPAAPVPVPTPKPVPAPKPEPKEESPLTSKRFWTWFTTGGIGSVFAAIGALDPMLQLLLGGALVALAAYAIFAMPAVRKKLGLR